MIPDFSYEQYYWSRGYDLVIGIDEVGRGAFAGPVVVGAVAFGRKQKTEDPPSSRLRRASRKQKYFGFIESLGINDSKKVKTDDREKLAPLIKKHCRLHAIGSVGVSVINKVGIGKATMMAMRKAIYKIQTLQLKTHNLQLTTHNHTSVPKTFILCDAFHVPYLRGIGVKNQEAIVRGDQQSISIAAASIIAKVYRDSIMRRLAKKFTNYGWEKNVGYGTDGHRQAILTYGQTCYHRVDFVETWKRRMERVQGTGFRV